MNIFELYQSEWLYELLCQLGWIGLNRAVADSFQWLIEVSAIITVLYLLFRLVGIFDKKRIAWHFLTRHLFFLFCVVWVMGFITYCWGMYVKEANVFSFAPQAVLQAFGMFLSQSDISLVQTDRHESAFYMVFFSISHLLAVSLSLLFVIKHFGNYFRFMAKRWAATSLFSSKREELYVFWGKCQGSILLAEDILNNKALKDNSRVVLVHTSDDSQGEIERMGINQLVSMMTLKDEELEQLQMDGGLVFKSYKRLSKLDMSQYPWMEIDKESGVSVLEDMLDQRSLIKIFNHKTGKREVIFCQLYHRLLRFCRRFLRIKGNGETDEGIGIVRFFMLTDDYKSNVGAIKNLLYDSDLRSTEMKVEIYCLARPAEVDDLQYSFDKLTAVKTEERVQSPEEKLHSDEITSDEPKNKQKTCKIKVHVIDASMLAISQLKQGSQNDHGVYHPVRYMDVDTQKVCATTSFNGMILGFGDTGREALSFMYEFSAIPDENGEKMESQILVFDKAMNEKRGAFYEQHPAFDGDESEIRLIQADIQSETFLRELAACVRLLDYVIVCTGNDDINLQVATRLFNYAYRYREGVASKLGIYVCCTRKDNYQHMQDMEKHYNEISSENLIEMHIFGSPKDIFTHRLIVANTILNEAMRFHMKYTIAKKKLKNNASTEINPEVKQELANKEKWEAEFNLQNEYWEIRFNKLCNMKQNLSNSLHIDTKLSLVGLSRSDNNCQEELVYWNNCALEHNNMVCYPNHPHEFEQLATCEHLRWEASMKMLGYTFAEGGRNDRTRNHPCLKPFKQLREDTQKYDYLVVDTSFAISVENLLKGKRG